MKRSDQVDQLATALAKAQGQFESVERNREVKVTMRENKGKYTFWYCTLDAIVDVIRKPLADNGLCYAQGVNGSENGTVVETMLMHSSGQWLETQTPVRLEGQTAQSLGSGITYAKRYALTALLGIVAEEDDDANDADGNQVETQRLDRPASKRSADNPNWRGPLPKTELKKEITKLVSAIGETNDAQVFTGILGDYIDAITQCVADLPDWWVHKTGGVKQAISDRAASLGVKVGTLLDQYERDSEKAPTLKAAE